MIQFKKKKKKKDGWIDNWRLELTMVDVESAMSGVGDEWCRRTWEWWVAWWLWFVGRENLRVRGKMGCYTWERERERERGGGELCEREV